jgi:hypothetical protein
MASDKQEFRFRADDDVEAYLEEIPKFTRSAEINRLLRKAIQSESGAETLEERVARLEEEVLKRGK